MPISYKKDFRKGAPVYTIHSLKEFDMVCPLKGVSLEPTRTPEETKRVDVQVKQIEDLCKFVQSQKEEEHRLELLLNKSGFSHEIIENIKKHKESFDNQFVKDDNDMVIPLSDILKIKAAVHDNAAKAKGNLVKIMYHATFPDGKSSAGMSERAIANGLCIYDWDGIWDMTPQDRLAIVISSYSERGLDFYQEEGILLAHVTPSGHGLRFVFKADPAYNIADNQLRFAQRIGVPQAQHDKSVHDLSRISYAVPMTKEYLLHLDETLFSYHNEEYSKRWSTWNQENNDSNNTEKLPLPLRSADHYSGKIKEIEDQKDEQEVVNNFDTEPNYMGIPYSVIIKKWWEMYNDGIEPYTNNRNTLTYEIAVNLRHIAGFDRSLLDRIIPNYDGFPQSEKMSVIDSALRAERSRMPKKLLDVLNSLKSAYVDEPDVLDALDELEENEELYFLNLINEKVFPMGVADSLDGVHNTLKLPVLIAIGPIIGALATDVQLNIHYEPSYLNLTARIIGESGSGKSTIDPLWEVWAHSFICEHKKALEVEKAYKNLPAKVKEKTKRPSTATRIMSFRTSQAEVLTRADAVQGKHLISFTAELDQLAQNRGTSSLDTSAIERVAFDNKKFDTDFKSDTAGNGYIEQTKWNSVACGTGDSLYRSCRNSLAGDIQRLSIARTPGNEFSRLVIVPRRKQKSIDNIHRIASLLPLMKGEVNLDRLEQACQDWLEKVRLDCLRDDDAVRASLRKRPPISAMRYVTCFLLCAYAEKLIRQFSPDRKSYPKWADGCTSAEQYLELHPDRLEWHLKRILNDDWINLFSVLSTYLHENLIYYFHSPITAAKNTLQSNYTNRKRRHGRNHSIYSSLPQEFSLEQAVRAKGTNASRNSVHQMLKNWINQGIIAPIGNLKYKKINS